MNNKEYGVNINTAYSFMFLSVLIIYASVCLILVDAFDVAVGDKIYRYFMAVIFFSYVTNYVLLHRNDNYKSYFKEFDQAEHKSQVFASALLFHSGVIVFGILSVHFTIGFDL